jgi:hypothetical protein
METLVRWVCDGCYSDWMRMLRRGPEIRPRVYGRGRGYYFQPLNTWFEEIGGAWPCPACDQFYDSFTEVVRHFAGRHPEKASSGVEEAAIEGVRAYRCWQGLYCQCGWLCENENHLLYHFRREHG